MLQTVGPDGGSVPCSSVGTAPHVAVSVVDEETKHFTSLSEVWPSGSGLVCFEHDYALPALVFPVSPVTSGSGCSGPGPVFMLFPNPVAPSGYAQSQAEWNICCCCPVLAHSDVILRPGQPASWPSLGGSPQEVPLC